MTNTFLVCIVAISLLINGCAPAWPESNQANAPGTSMSESKPLPGAASNNDPHTIAEVEKLASFDVKEPAYLPTGVSFEFAMYQTTPNPIVTLYFKIIHEQYGDMGRFFQIMQEPQTKAPPDVISCGEQTEGCELLDIENTPVVYRQYASRNGEGMGTEGLDWYADGYVFRLLRVAGEPNKIYKDELIKVVSSME